MMVTMCKGGVYFIATETFKCVAQIRLPRSQVLWSASILSDRRICVIGVSGYCGIFSSPDTVKVSIAKCAEKMMLEARQATRNPRVDDVVQLKAELAAQKLETEKGKADIASLMNEMEKIRAERGTRFGDAIEFYWGRTEPGR